MNRFLKTFGAAAIVLSLGAAPALAQQPSPKGSDRNQIEESIRNSIEKILRAFQGLADSVPIYEMPEIQKNGDILIRRKQRKPAPKPGANDDSSST